MKRLALLTLSLLMLSQNIFANNQISENIQAEFKRLYDLTKQVEAEYDVGDYLLGKKYPDGVELLWRHAQYPGDADIIRIYRDYKDSNDAFAVSYFRSQKIIKGRTVLRRFVGPIITGWRNDTIDYKTGEYLGLQGMSDPMLDEADQKVLKDWGVWL